MLNYGVSLHNGMNNIFLPLKYFLPPEAVFPDAKISQQS